MKKLISILVVCLLIAALSPAVFADDIWESPDIAQADRTAGS